MKSLLVLRHAKSSWKDPELADHDRPLSKRGRRDAPRMGRLMRELSLLPEVVLCSTATRAQSTLGLALDAADWSCERRFSPALYTASPDDIVALLRELPGRVGRVLVVGHNPALEELVRELTGKEVALPTGALARLDWRGDEWGDFGAAGTVELAQLWMPKQ